MTARRLFNCFNSFVFLFVFLTPLSAIAGGALKVMQGEPVLWPEKSFPVVYNLDRGDLGPISHDDATALIVKAFNAWQSPDTTSIRLERGPDLPVDVDGSNFQQYLDHNTPSINPIVLDNDGSIIQALAGNGADKDVLGLAGPVEIFNEQIAYNQIVFNGVILEEHDFGPAELYPTLLHEFGHFLGLDHSQIFRHIAYDYVGANDAIVPIMLPDAADDESRRDRLTDEDILSISSLYPAPNLHERTGSISGLVRRDGTELPGVNVIAQRVGAVTDQIYSFVTGTYEINRGTFRFTGLPPGGYRIYIEPLDRSYTGISSVGQYAINIMSNSFRNPPAAQFYLDEGKSFGRSRWTPITVQAGEVIRDINIDVQSESSPSDEIDTQLLGLNVQEIGGVSGSGTSVFQFLLVPSGNEGQIEVNIIADDPTAQYDVMVSEDQRVHWSDVPIRSSLDGSAAFFIGMDGDLPLAPQRYFISIYNRSTQDITFSIIANSPGSTTVCPFSVY